MFRDQSEKKDLTSPSEEKSRKKEESCKIFILRDRREVPQKVANFFVKRKMQEYTHHEKITG